jgi:hypothetical protein
MHTDTDEVLLKKHRIIKTMLAMLCLGANTVPTST